MKCTHYIIAFILALITTPCHGQDSSPKTADDWVAFWLNAAAEAVNAKAVLIQQRNYVQERFVSMLYGGSKELASCCIVINQMLEMEALVTERANQATAADKIHEILVTTTEKVIPSAKYGFDLGLQNNQNDPQVFQERYLAPLKLFSEWIQTQEKKYKKKHDQLTNPSTPAKSIGEASKTKGDMSPSITVQGAACPLCDGKGTIFNGDKCSLCNGTGGPVQPKRTPVARPTEYSNTSSDKRKIRLIHSSEPQVVAQNADSAQSKRQQITEPTTTRKEATPSSENASNGAAKLEEAANAGDAKAQYEFGMSFTDFPNPPKDAAKAIYWLEKSATQGYRFAQGALGSIYFYAVGAPADPVKASKWLKLAADQGDAFAQTRLGVMFRHGYGEIEENHAKAAKWFEKAAAQGQPEAQASLGALLEEGDGVTRDGPRAFDLYKASAAQGYPVGIYNLALAYANGFICKKDLLLAYAWATLGITKEYDAAGTLRQKVEVGMTPEQKIEGQRIARQLHEKSQL